MLVVEEWCADTDRSPPLCCLPNVAPFFFNDTATTEIYTLSLHDALPISRPRARAVLPLHERLRLRGGDWCRAPRREDRKSTRLNSSHSQISYAVFCLKKNFTSSCLT